MLPIQFANRKIMQCCWIVPDLRKAIIDWSETTGVGPFWWIDSVEFEEAQSRGKPAQFPNVTAAMSQAGEIQIELIQLNDDGPSFFHDLVPRGSTGMHHTALYCEDFDADLANYTRNGAEVAFSGRIWGQRTAWVDTSAKLGFMMELIEKTPSTDAGFANYRDSAANWDGKDPFRYFT